MNMHPSGRRWGRHFGGAIVAACAVLSHATVSPEPSFSAEAVKYVWVQVAPPGVGIVRAITEAATCPEVRFDRWLAPMKERAAPDSDFKVLTCEATIPRGTHRIEVAGKRLLPPPVHPRRIAVIGDTGCRLKQGEALDNGFQACNDADQWEFAKVARQVAASRPDLIIQVGDYIYREQMCPEGNKGCEGSPFNSPGMRWETWEADYFRPAAPMLEAAPIVFVRGDHEQCERAGPGFFRFLDPFPPRCCLDFTDPYTISFTGLQLVVMDTVQAVDTSLSPEAVRARYKEDFKTVAKLATGNTWLLSHRPIWGVRPTKKKDGSEVEILNITVQDALREALGALPPQIELVLTGHIHLAELLSFAGGRPPQMVMGTGGTLLLPEVTKDIVGSTIDGEPVSHATILSTHGFVTLEPRGHHAWQVAVRNEAGAKLAECRLADKSIICRPE